jgi:hypothetical protein
MDSAILIGAFSGLVSFGMACITLVPANQHMRIPHVAVATGMSIAWCIGTCLIVYGGGPGESVGSIFFSTWLSLFLCLDLVTTNICVYLKRQQGLKQKADQRNNDDQGGLSPEETVEDGEAVHRNGGDWEDVVENGCSQLPLETKVVNDLATRQELER